MNIAYITTIAAVAGLVITLIFSVLKADRDSKNECTKRSNKEGKMETKLDEAIKDIKEIKDDTKETLKELRGENTALRVEVAKVGESADSAHKRIDGIEKKMGGVA